MGWTAHYQLLRAQPLTTEEIAAIARQLQTARAEPWESEPISLEVPAAARADHVIANGMSKMAMDDDQTDAVHLCTVLNRILRALPGAEPRIWDDFGMLGADGGLFSTEGDRTALPIDVPRGELVDPTSLAPPPLPALPKRIEALVDQVSAGAEPASLDLAGDKVARDLLTAFTRLAKQDPRKPVLERLAAAIEPERLARVGLAAYPKLQHDMNARREIWRAANAAADHDAVVEAFVQAWRGGTGTYYYGDMSPSPAFKAAMGARAAVVAQLVEDVRATEQGDPRELAFRRAEQALEVLVAGGSARGVAETIDVLRRNRGVARGSDFVHHVQFGAFKALGRHGDRRALPTMIYELATMTKAHGIHDVLIERLPAIDPARARPILLRLSAPVLFSATVVRALGQLDGDDVTARLRELTVHPTSGKRAREVLVARGVDPSPPIDDPAPETLIAHPEDEVRREALQTIHRRKDLSTFVSLVAAAQLDRRLRAVSGSTSLPFMWNDWRDLIPREVRGKSQDEVAAWAAGEGAPLIGPQQILPAIAAVLERGPDEVAAGYPDPRLRLPADEVAALLAEETAVLEALRATA